MQGSFLRYSMQPAASSRLNMHGCANGMLRSRHDEPVPTLPSSATYNGTNNIPCGEPVRVRSQVAP